MKSFKLTKSKFRALSTLSSNYSEVFMASLVIPAIIGGVEKYRIPTLLLGIIGTTILFLFALFTAERGKL